MTCPSLAPGGLLSTFTNLKLGVYELHGHLSKVNAPKAGSGEHGGQCPQFERFGKYQLHRVNRRLMEGPSIKAQTSWNRDP